MLGEVGEVVVVVVSAKLELRCTSSDVGVMFRENAYDAGGCFMVDDFFCCLKISAIVR